jgi:hypothetical protein
MRDSARRLFISGLVGQAAMLIVASGGGAVARQTSPGPEAHSYHDRPPAEPLPVTLAPDLFKGKRLPFLVYTLARQIEPTLYQVPCYCPCDKLEGHTSLLDCFTSRHGERCPRCQIEVIFCFEQHKQGKTPTEIRKGLEEHQATKIDLNAYADAFFAREASVSK